MNLAEISQRAAHFIQENSPAILTALGVAGVGGTGYLAARAGFQAQELINQKELEKSELLTKREKFELTWKLYILSVGTGLVTATAVVGAHTVHSRRQAALISVVTLSERALTEYREKVTEIDGEKKDQKVRDAIAQDRVNENPPPEGLVIAGTDVPCYDIYSDRYFVSDMETIRRAVNDVNEECNNFSGVSLNEFYSKIGLGKIGGGDTIGFNSERKLDPKFSSILADGGKPVLALDFRNEPVTDYDSPWRS